MPARAQRHGMGGGRAKDGYKENDKHGFLGGYHHAGDRRNLTRSYAIRQVDPEPLRHGGTPETLALAR
jgi:hypothetical protein